MMEYSGRAGGCGCGCSDVGLIESDTSLRLIWSHCHQPKNGGMMQLIVSAKRFVRLPPS